MATPVHQQTIISIATTAARVRRAFGDVMGAEGIGGSQYNILRILRGEGGPLPIMTIRDRMFDPEPSITRLVDRLVERDLVSRARCDVDRRRVHCTITEEGLAVLERLDRPIDEKDLELVADLTTTEMETLSALLGRVGQSA
jgi:DNA-binding MarR family transcriptional regulator